jgi:hypothetical protein
MKEKLKKRTKEWNLALLKRIFRMSKQPKECILTTVRLASGLGDDCRDPLTCAEQTDVEKMQLHGIRRDEDSDKLLTIAETHEGIPPAGK